MSGETGQPRMRCRLPCTIRAGRRRIHARVLDVSPGGLCVMARVRFKPGARVNIEILGPRRGPVTVEGEVRYGRPFRQPSSGRRGWATGFALGTAAPGFLALSRPGALTGPTDGQEVVETLRRVAGQGPLDVGVEERLAPARERAPRDAPTAPRGRSPGFLVSEQSLYRVRLKAVGSAHTRTLTLPAPSEAAVCEAVLRDLEGDWEVLGARRIPATEVR
jgi:hypothetical protein